MVATGALVSVRFKAAPPFRHIALVEGKQEADEAASRSGVLGNAGLPPA